MATTLLLELFGGFAGACFAIWLVSESLPAPRDSLLAPLVLLKPAMLSYLQRPGMLASVGLLLLRLS
jgi:hypothetical protein